VTKPSSSTESDLTLSRSIDEKTEIIGRLIEAGEIRTAYQEFLSLSSIGNKYFEDNKPWAIIKTDKQKTSGILYNCVGLCRSLAVLSNPFLPSSSKRVWDQLNFEGSVDTPGNWDDASRHYLSDSHTIKGPQLLYRKFTDDVLNKFKSIVTVPTELGEYFK